MKIILVVDDEGGVIASIKTLFSLSKLSRHFEFVSATSRKDAINFFDENSTEIVAICLDGCLNPEEPGRLTGITVLHTALIADFTGPIIAMSSEKNFRDIMLTAGCSESVDKKTDVIRRLEHLLLG